MRAKLLPTTITTAAVFCLGGCYPTLLTSRPEARIVVTHESGAPLEGATVTLGTMEWHGIVGQNTLENFLTDREGKVGFGAQHEWATQLMLPDGDTRYSWSLCFSKPGFEAIPMTQIDFSKPIEVTMYPSEVPSECEWPQSGYTPRVKLREGRWIEVAGGEWQSNPGIAMMLDQAIRPAMEASAREQGVKLHSWSQYRFQYQTGGKNAARESYILIHALCRAPEAVDLTQAFYSEPDEGACFFDTKYTLQSWADQPPPAFTPLAIVGDKG